MYATKRARSSTRIFPTKKAVLAAIFVVAAAAVAPGSAGAATAETEGQGSGPFCAILVGKAPAGGVSPVLAEACSDTSAEEAAAAIKAAHRKHQGATGSGTEAATVRIMLWYENVDYNRVGNTNPPTYVGRMTQIYGSYGPCDSSGYRVEPDSWWKSNMSSIVGDNGCYVARIHNKAKTSSQDFGIRVNGDGHWLGSYSDNVGLTQPRA